MQSEYVGASNLQAAWILLQTWVRPTQDTHFLIIVPDESRAALLLDDLKALASFFFNEKTAESEFEFLHIRSWSHDPYTQILPSIQVRMERVEALSKITLPSSKKIVCVATGLSFVQAAAEKDIFVAHTLKVKKNDDTQSREDFTLRLMERGYLKQDPVEDRGSFCLRGEIIDIFPPHADHPYRIELFDTLIERIRPFDEKTQRTSTEECDELILPPAREVYYHSDLKPRLRQRLKEHADSVGTSRSKRDPILQQIENGDYPTHSDLWIPFLAETPATLANYFKEIAVIDRDETARTLKESLAEFEKTYGTRELEDQVPPPPGLLFPGTLPNPSLSFESFAQHPEHFESSKKIQSEQLVSDGPKGLWEQVARFNKSGFRVVVFCSTQTQIDRTQSLASERGLRIETALGEISESQVMTSEGIALLNDEDLVGLPSRRKKIDRSDTPKGWSGIQNLTDLEVGDAVVHVDHGIGLYQGLVRLKLDGVEDEFLLLEYSNKDKLYLPVYRLNVIQKYFGAQEAVNLDRLGSQNFQKAKAKVQDEVKKIAFDLLKVYAERAIRTGPVFPPRDRDLEEFESRFRYVETPDQSRAIDDTLHALTTGKIMDRIVCGDVGFGKTEVAIRAAFRVISSGKQVAVLVPTTLLAHQHEQTFKARFKDYPFNIESIFRFKTSKEQKKVVEDVQKGKVDILIGTHRVLSKDVEFHDLGLLIIDEEHRFGVEQKEKMKAMRTDTHVLSLTATPIPRTLQMSLSGLRDISIISTPPVNRLPIRTFVSRFSEELTKTAIETELARGGQVFFVHNRVQGIEKMAAKIRELVPHARVIVGHAQMSETELEKVMIAFYERQADVLVCTTIIESGLDIPSANTILVHRADTFGLAQLYQIRGRVGRGDRRAYAYLFLPEEGSITEDARKRLEVLQRFVELGSGFSIASHDLEIRGGGELLGASQSGHMGSVGFEMYTQMLEEAIADLRGAEPTASQAPEPEIKTPYSCFLPEAFIPDVHQRLGFYRRLSASSTETDLLDIEKEMQDRYGPIPEEALNLFWLIRIKQHLKKLRATHLIASKERFSATLSKDSPIDPARAIAQMARDPKGFMITPESKLVCPYRGGSIQELFGALESTLKKITPPDLHRSTSDRFA